MWSRVTGVLNRHKGKLISGAVLAGGVWYYYRDTIKQAWEMYQLLQEMSNATIDSGDQEENEPYRQTVLTGDETSQKNFNQIRIHRADLYADDLENVQSQLRSSSTGERESTFTDLCALTFSRLYLSIVISYCLLLLARIEVCLIGKANRQQVSEGIKADHRELLGGLRFVTSKETMSAVDSVIRRIVKDRLFSPTTIVTREQLAARLGEIALEIVAHLRKDRFNWLLGDLAFAAEESSDISKETLDIVESPQFESVLVFLVKQGLGVSLKRSIPDSVSRNFPLAVLIAGIKAEAESVTTINSPHVLVLQSSPIVDELCLAVYCSSSPPRDEELEALVGNHDDDPNMAKLGELLEKLVKADISSSEASS